MIDFFLILGGLFAGIINTLAGNGSVITLSLCTEVVGLTPSMANGTNRIGVLSQSITGIIGLVRQNKLELKNTYSSMIMVLLGALVGIWVAIEIDESLFKKLYPYFLLFILIVLLLKPERWIQSKVIESPSFPWYLWPIYFLIGVYGGMIQMGVGVFFLAASIMISHLTWSVANAAKILVIGLFTLLAVVLFWSHGMVHIRTALFLATGQTIGAWIGVKYLTQLKFAHTLSYFILIAVTGYTVVKHFIFSWFFAS